mgnify:CR=1 FL=1
MYFVGILKESICVFFICVPIKIPIKVTKSVHVKQDRFNFFFVKFIEISIPFITLNQSII